MASRIKLGTRRSLLAWAQSSWVARELERLNPGLEIELIGIETRGDRIQNIPLQEVQGKEFFVAELDEALISGKVDLTVHSMKDLSLDRPKEIILAAVPKRKNPRDVILFGSGVIEKIRSGKPLQIGTSSPRRLENIPDFVSKAIPHLAPSGEGTPKTEWIEIRGNVNTRLNRLRLSTERKLDAVVLAFAGLIRLWEDEAAREEMNQLLEGLRWMILPLAECPAAPAQGALAVECRAHDHRVREMLAKIHDPVTGARIAKERELLADWGGGCHQKFGATAVSSPELGELLYIRGVKPNGDFVEELRWERPVRPGFSPVNAWSSQEWRSDRQSQVPENPLPRQTLSGKAVFLAHSRALPAAWGKDLGNSRVWVSGKSSWFQLAKRGIWVEGCAEGQGIEDLLPTLGEAVLSLPPFQDWTVLTHASAVETWPARNGVPTYSARTEWSEEALAALKKATHVYWGSGSEFESLKEALPAAGLNHACGPGKTAKFLRTEGIRPMVFPSLKEWKKWLGI